jgi:hypothetical protein
MKKRKIILIVIVLLGLTGFYAIARSNDWFGGSGGPAIDAKEELRKLYALYSRQDTQLHIDGVIRLYDKEEKDALKETTPFSYHRTGRQLHSHLGYLFYFMDDSLMVQLDTMNRVITVSRITQDQQPAIQTGLPFERFMHDSSTFKITATVEEERGARKLTLTNDLDPNVKSSVIYYDPSNYVVKRAEIAWWKQAMVYSKEDAEKKIWLAVMEYDHSAVGGAAVKERINEVISWKDGKPVATKLYAGYQVAGNY